MRVCERLFVRNCFPSLSPSVSGDESTETTVTASPGDVALLPCYTAGNVTPSVTAWEKNGREVISDSSSSSSSSSSLSPAAQRVSVLHDGSLNINGVTPGDEGSYLCASTLPGNITFHARVLLQVAGKSVRGVHLFRGDDDDMTHWDEAFTGML